MKKNEINLRKIKIRKFGQNNFIMHKFHGFGFINSNGLQVSVLICETFDTCKIIYHELTDGYNYELEPDN